MFFNIAILAILTQTPFQEHPKKFPDRHSRFNIRSNVYIICRVMPGIKSSYSDSRMNRLMRSFTIRR